MPWPFEPFNLEQSVNRPETFPVARRRHFAARPHFLRAALGTLVLTAGILLLSASIRADPSPLPTVHADTRSESTRKMAALLESIRLKSDPMRNAFRATEQVPRLRELVLQKIDPQARLGVQMQLAEEILETGDCEGALKEYDEIETFMRENPNPSDAHLLPELWTDKAICYLRMGEQENCCSNHNPDSCIFPIRGEGIHTKTRGSRGAIVQLTELLTRYPGDLRARWLLNIAYSTLGEYPAKVPAQWLIDPKVFASDYDIKHFPDVAEAVGLDIDALAGGVLLEDFDNDGLLDVMVSAWGLTDQLRLFHNNGNGTFTEKTLEAGLKGEVGGLNLIQCDYNNDGFIDVLVLRGAWLRSEGHYPVSLLRNNGDGTFTDVTEQAGLMRLHPTQTAVWFDYDGDGWLDLFIGNESTEGDVSPCELFHNNGDGTFTECAAEVGVAKVDFFKGVISGDYNNDGRPDLFLSRRNGPPILLRNEGPGGPYSVPRASWHFTDVTEDAGITDPSQSFTCWFWDYDNDGWPDIFVSGYAIQDVGDIAADYMGVPSSGQKARLYHNNHDGTFTDVTKAVGLNKVLHTMGGNFGDLDNDGWLDFYAGTGDPSFSTLIPNRMFRNDGGTHFQDVTTSGGFGQLQKGHGIAFGDINNDGAQDIYSVVGGAVEADHFHHQLFANPGHGNHWLKLKLEGVKSNRAAIGARIKVVLNTPTGERTLYRTVGSGGSFGASTLRQEIGLGQAQSIDRVEIIWPIMDGPTQIIKNLQSDHAYSVREGAGEAVEQTLKTFKWPVSPDGTQPTSAPPLAIGSSK